MTNNLYASIVVAWALRQVGYKETGTNINKYAADIDKNYPSFYNGKKQGAEWCDVFVDDGFINCYGEANARTMLYQPKKSLGAGCKYSARYYKAAKAWYKSPKVGDQIFFGRDGSETHTGIVVSVGVNTVITVEGNKGNAVKKCSYNLKDSKIAGYGRPRYETEPDVKPDEKGDKIMIEVRVLHKGNSGEDVKTIQRILKQEGYKYNNKVLAIDGDFGSATDSCVRAYQSKNGLKVDGWVGPDTWNKLING